MKLLEYLRNRVIDYFLLRRDDIKDDIKEICDFYILSSRKSNLFNVWIYNLKLWWCWYELNIGVK